MSTRTSARVIASYLACAFLLSAAFGAPDIRVTPLSLNLSRVTNKQIYVEIDWMELAGDHSHKPSQNVIDRIVETFGREGFDIHIDVSNAIPHQNNINVPNGVESDAQVQAIMNAHFNHRNDPRYYYSLWCHKYNGGNSSGVGDLPGRVHLVTLGSWAGQTGTEDEQVGTFIHEFGHNLGQKHGGAPSDGDNYKPNFVSVMNYHFQTTGIGNTLFANGWANTAAGWNEFGYSHGTLPDLDETNLDENVGIGLGRAVDWNNNGSTTDTAVKKCIHDAIMNVEIGTALPAGWTVIDNAGTGKVWRFDDPGSRGNKTGGSGGFAMADSDNAGAFAMDTELRTLVLNCSNKDDIAIEFATDFRHYDEETADVDVSVNGAAGPWTNLWRKTGSHFRGPARVVLEVPQAADESNVMFRFRYHGAHHDWWWQVDDVSVGELKVLRDYDNWGGIVSQVRNNVLMPDMVTPKRLSEPCITSDAATQHKKFINELLARRGADPGLAAAVLPAAVVPTNGFTIFNDGDQDLVVSGITPETAAPWLSVSPTFPMTIEAGGSRTVAVAANYNIAPDGTTTTRLLIASNDPDENPYPGGLNVTVNQGPNPNLAPFKPAGCSDNIVVSNVTGTNADSVALFATDTLRVDFAVINSGLVGAAAGFDTEVYVDGVLATTVPTSSLLSPGSWTSATDLNIGTLAAGTHTVRIQVDSEGAVTEHVETDNEYTKTFDVYSASYAVSTSGDSGAGSLRQTIADAATGGIIVFDASLSGATIALTSGELSLNKNLTIDASALPGGITISGNGASRVFYVNTGASLTLRGITLTGGNGAGTASTGNGGAIFSIGTLAASGCSFLANSCINHGGAVANAAGGVAKFTNCTFFGNSQTNAGGLGGGAISHTSDGTSLMLTHCTIVENSAAGADGGGGIRSRGAGCTLSNCIVSGNKITVGTGADVNTTEILTRAGANIIATATSGGGSLAGPAHLTADPRFAPLASNGGPTKTLALLPGSPALDAVPLGGIVGGLTTDQRGFPRSRDGDAAVGALPDIGAYEAQVEPLSIGFNFVGGGPAGTTGTLASTDVAGAFAQANWNNLTTNYDGTSSGAYTNGPASIKDGSGASISPNLQLWWNAPNGYGQPAAGLTTPDLKLMGGYLDSNASGDGSAATNLYTTINAQPFLAVAGLPAAATRPGYKVIVYTDIAATDGRISRYWLTSNRGQNPTSVGGEIALTGSVFTRDTSDFSGTYTRATATTDSGASTPGGNYVVFENLAEPGGFIVRAEEGSLPASNQARAPINAVQIVRNEILVVTTTLDENDPNGTLGTGVSLREALRDAPDGAGIVFDSTLSGQTIALTLGSEIVVTGKRVTIDASSLPAGITLDGGAGTNRILTVGSGANVTLRSLTFTGGNGTGAAPNNNGGAVLCNAGTLTIERCTFTGNTAAAGGGALINFHGTATLIQCTFSGNSGGSGGGAIFNRGTMLIKHCTVSGNTPSANGAIFNYGLSRLTLENTIVAGNSTGGPEVYNHDAQVTRVGANLITSLVNASGGTDSGPTAITAAPQLASLGSYGGPTQTMPPLAGSPAIDAAVGSTFTTDQRGLPVTGGVPDIGAAERQYTTVVSSAADLGEGSLRSALNDAVALPGPDTITFATGFTGPVLLASELVISDAASVTIDASGIVGGVTINGGAGTNRIFIVSSGMTFALNNLTLTGGDGAGATNTGDGGAILNLGALTLTDCTVSGNTATRGGGIQNEAGTLTVNRCTIAANTAVNAGGGISNDRAAGTLTAIQSTFSGNTATNTGGGAMHNANNATSTLTHCTISGNQSPSGAGGGIRRASGSVTITNCIVTGNTASSSANLNGTITQTEANLTTGSALLAPLGTYGGPTQTMALLPGSPARNAATGSTVTSDQRGFPIISTPDIGAYEAGTFTNFNAWIYETLPATATLAQHAATFDVDGDGVTNENEWLARTDPGNASSWFRITQSAISGGTFSVAFPTVLGRSYQLQSSPNLADPWTDIGSVVAGTGSELTLPVNVSGVTRHFFRVRVQ